MDRRMALVALQERPARYRIASPVASLGFVMHDGAATAGVDVDAAQRLSECVARLRDRLTAVRPAMARLRSVLPGPRDTCAPRSRDFVELATADVERALVQARRSVRALAAELADLEAEGRDLIALAATLDDCEPALR